MLEENEWETRRQKLIKFLKEYDAIHDLRTLMREMEYPNKKVLINDIESITKTLKNDRIILQIQPASCIGCGFVFRRKPKDAFKIPSKCPKCKQQRIEWPSLKIKKY